MATLGDRNKYDVYSNYTVTNSYTFVSNCWFLAHIEASAQGHEIFQIVQTIMYMYILNARIYVYRYKAKGLAGVRLCAIRSSMHLTVHGP